MESATIGFHARYFLSPMTLDDFKIKKMFMAMMEAAATSDFSISEVSKTKIWLAAGPVKRLNTKPFM